MEEKEEKFSLYASLNKLPFDSFCTSVQMPFYGKFKILGGPNTIKHKTIYLLKNFKSRLIAIGGHSKATKFDVD